VGGPPSFARRQATWGASVPASTSLDCSSRPAWWPMAGCGFHIAGRGNAGFAREGPRPSAKSTPTPAGMRGVRERARVERAVVVRWATAEVLARLGSAGAYRRGDLVPGHPWFKSPPDIQLGGRSLLSESASRAAFIMSAPDLLTGIAGFSKIARTEARHHRPARCPGGRGAEGQADGQAQNGRWSAAQAASVSTPSTGGAVTVRAPGTPPMTTVRYDTLLSRVVSSSLCSGSAVIWIR
jgi:hypothetical protein